MAQAFLLTALLLSASAPATPAAATRLDADRIERLTGAQGTLDADGSFHVVIPPQGLSASPRRARLTPSQELGSWATFTPGGEAVAVAAAFVLTREQVAPVLTAALDAGLEVTALHDHFFWDDPPLRALHVRGQGTQDAMAAGVGRVVKALRGAGTPRRASKVAVGTAEPTLVAVVEPILTGGGGKLEEGLYRLAFGAPRGRPAATWGDARPGAWAAFAGSPAKAVVAGDLAMPATDLQGVLRGLRAGGFEIAAVHPHLANGGVAFVVLSYWGVGEASDLAKSLRDTLRQAGVPASDGGTSASAAPHLE